MSKQIGRYFQKLEIGLASPKEIRSWAERYLPNGEVVGEVTSWETVNYKTLKPEPNGLFCQRIFGPIIDYTCACGKRSNKILFGFCPKCGVERTTSRVRRYRLGYIELKQPVVHPLYATTKPSPLSLCINWSNKRLQAVLYATEFCHISEELNLFLSRFGLYQLLRDYMSIRTQHSLQFEKIFKVLLISRTHFFSYFDQILFKEQLWSPRLYSFKSNKIFHQRRKIQKSLLPKFFKKQKTRKIKKQNIKRLYPPFDLDLGTHVYGIAYDMTWRQIEDLQDFLVFIAENPFSYEFSVPYYKFPRPFISNSFLQKLDHQQFFPIQTGGFAFHRLLVSLDLLGLQLQLRRRSEELKTELIFVQELYESIAWWSEEKVRLLQLINRIKQTRKNYLRRLQYTRDFYKTKTQPAWMILSIIPVLPPGLRPITSIRGELVVSDINSLYRKLLTRNKRIVSPARAQFSFFDTTLSGTWSSWCYNLRQVQEAVDNLFKTGSTESGKTTKSLLDNLKGKKGRFRQHLLGKRVDYSGRSVIVVGPKLKIHECGLPKQIAIELFQPFLIQKLRNKKIAPTITAAKAIICERKPVIWPILEEILINHPILLNRAPTLHRLGIQAFLPKLVEGKAILLHPLVCPAFNADFDGDQMAVHVPLSTIARAEALNLLWSRNHLLSPASGQPLLLPTQDMVLGCYYLTTSKEVVLKQPNRNIGSEGNYDVFTYPEFYFSNIAEAQNFYDREKIQPHTPIWIKWMGRMQNFFPEQQSKLKEFPLEYRLDIQGNSEILFSDRVEIQKIQSTTKIFYMRTTSGRVFFHNYLFRTVLSS